MSITHVTSMHHHRTRLSGPTQLVRFGFLALMLIGFNGVGIWLAGRNEPKWVLLALLVAAIATSFGAERIAPYERSWNNGHADSGRDFAHGVVNEAFQILMLFALPVLVDAMAINRIWPTQLPFAVQVLGSLIVLDAGVTLGHYWSHKWALLWRFHAVHHSVLRFYGFNGLMKHPFHQLFETTLATAPLILLGLPTEVATALVFCVGIQLLVQHSNVDYAIGPVRWLLAVNQLHRFHHLRWPVVGDVNFGLFTNVWDHLLGTYVWDPKHRFTSADIGIAAEPNFPVRYVDQLLKPLRSH